MRLVDRVKGIVADAVHEIIDEGCPVVRDPDTGKRCGRPRYAGRRCMACLEQPGKPAGLVAEHAREYGGSLIGAFLEKARLSGAGLEWVTMRSARLRGADLSGADLRSTDFRKADVAGASFRGADLTYSRLRDLTGLAGASFDGGVLEKIVLTTRPSAPVEGASFAGADLAHAVFADADLHGARFAGARLVGADFRRANLAGCDFTGADMTDADLAGADVSGASFEGAVLERARLPGGKGRRDLQEEEGPSGLPRALLGRCMRAFVNGPASARAKLRVLARKAPEMMREDALDLILPMIGEEDLVRENAREAVAALRALGREEAARPFLMGLLARGPEDVRLEAAAVLAEAPVSEETAGLFRTILTEGSDEEEFRKGVFRALAPAIEDRDEVALRLAGELVEARELFDGELIAALGQAGMDERGYPRELGAIASDRGLSDEARLAAARDLADRFFGAEACRTLRGILASEEEGEHFKRNVFWFVARRVSLGDRDATALARSLLESKLDIEPDIRWALVEGGDEGQIPYFLDVARTAAEEGWQEASSGRPDLPRYDDVVRAAQVLGRLGPPESAGRLSALVARESDSSDAAAGSPFTVAEAAREALAELRRRSGQSHVDATAIESLDEETADFAVAVADDETRVEEIPGPDEPAGELPAEGAGADEVAPALPEAPVACEVPVAPEVPEPPEVSEALAEQASEPREPEHTVPDREARAEAGADTDAQREEVAEAPPRVEVDEPRPITPAAPVVLVAPVAQDEATAPAVPPEAPVEPVLPAASEPAASSEPEDAAAKRSRRKGKGKKGDGKSARKKAPGRKGRRK